jgi:hypothetical protein
VVDGIGVYLPLWTAGTSIISFAAHVPLEKGLEARAEEEEEKRLLDSQTLFRRYVCTYAQ